MTIQETLEARTTYEPEAAFETTPAPYAAAPDYRPDGAQLILQLEQIPEGSSEELNELHNLHILSKEMRRVLHNYSTEVVEDYDRCYIKPLAQLYKSIRPGLKERVPLAESLSAKMDTLAVTQYKELYVISKLRFDIEKLAEPYAQLKTMLYATDQSIAQKETELQSAEGVSASILHQRGVAQSERANLGHSLAEPTSPTDSDETAGESRAETPRVSVEMLSQQLDKQIGLTQAITNQLNELQETKNQILQHMGACEQKVAVLRRQIATCFSVLQNNSAKWAILSEVGKFLKSDQDALMKAASELYRQAEALQEQHDLAMFSDDYDATDYLHADTSKLKALISDPIPALSEQLAKLQKVKVVESGIYENLFDESTKQNLQKRIEKDCFARQSADSSSTPKKLPLRQLPAHLQETEPDFYRAMRFAYNELDQIRDEAIVRHKYPGQYRSSYVALLQKSVSRNGYLLDAQKKAFITKVYAIDAGIENADNKLSAAKPMQLTLDGVTEKYTNYRKRQDPVIETFTRQVQINQQQTSKARTRVATLEADKSSLEQSLASYTAQASGIVRAERTRILDNLVIERERLEEEAQQDVFALESLMSDYGYGQPHADKATELPEHIRTIELATEIRAHLAATEKDLEKAREHKDKLEKEGDLLPRHLGVLRQDLREESTRYTRFSELTKSEIANLLKISTVELAKADTWFKRQDVEIVIHDESLKKAQAAEAPVARPEVTVQDWRPVLQPDVLAQKRGIRAMLGSASLRRVFNFGRTVKGGMKV